MDCIELSINDVRTQCRAWAEEINQEFQPQLLIYVAKAGYLIAEAMNEVFHADILGIDATRKGNKLKERFGKVFTHVPRFVHKWLISLEMKSNIHEKDTERRVLFHEKINSIKKNLIKNILIVDDSVDTGYSMVSVLEEVKKNFPDTEIKTASLNVWDKSKKVFITNYGLYFNMIIKAPMSKDSKEYKIFKEIYSVATQNGKL